MSVQIRTVLMAAFSVALTILCAGLSIGCGAAPEELELGVLQEAFSARNSPNYQFGVQTGAAHLQCNRTSANQVCSVPKTKSLQIAREPSVDIYGAEIQDAGIAIADLLDSGWDMDIVSSTDPLDASQVRLLLRTGNITGGLNDNIDRYSAVQLGSPTGLTEGVAPGANTPVGQYQKHGFCIGTVDVADIDLKVASGFARASIRRHAFAHAILTCLGLGSREDAGANSVYSRRAVFTGGALTGMTGGESCRANSFNATDNGDFSLTTDFTCAID